MKEGVGQWLSKVCGRLTKRRTTASFVKWLLHVTISVLFLDEDYERQSKSEWLV